MAIPEAEVMNDLVMVIAEEQKQEPQLDENKVKQEALTALQRINLMGISDRVRLALTGNKTERLVLIKDSNKLVQTAVLDSPKMADRTRCLIHARNLSLPGEIIGKIANNREWTKNYTVILALVRESEDTDQTAPSAFVKQLHARDLKLLIPRPQHQPGDPQPGREPGEAEGKGQIASSRYISSLTSKMVGWPPSMPGRLQARKALSWRCMPVKWLVPASLIFFHAALQVEAGLGEQHQVGSGGHLRCRCTIPP